MLVKMRMEVSGLRDGKPWPPVGGTVDLPDDEAVQMIQNGSAAHVYDPEAGVEMRDVVMESDGTLDTSARDALVPITTKRVRQR